MVNWRHLPPLQNILFACPNLQEAQTRSKLKHIKFGQATTKPVTTGILTTSHRKLRDDVRIRNVLTTLTTFVMTSLVPPLVDSTQAASCVNTLYTVRTILQQEIRRTDCYVRYIRYSTAVVQYGRPTYVQKLVLTSCDMMSGKTRASLTDRNSCLQWS